MEGSGPTAVMGEMTSGGWVGTHAPPRVWSRQDEPFQSTM
jgi:hypothetical protein